MEDPIHISSELLTRYVAGEADAQERDRVERWAGAHAGNAKEMEHFRAVWSWSDAELPDKTFDVDAAWKKVSGRVTGRGGKVIAFRRPVAWLAAAAVIAGLVFAARLLLPTPTVLYHASVHDTVMSTMLSDSSSVALAPGSSMKVRMGKERTVELTGSAYFDVARDPSRPFIVQAGALSVHVLGTAFRIEDPDTGSFSWVHVRHGQVRVSDGTSSVELGMDDHLRYDRSTGKMEESEPPSTLDWGPRIMDFRKAPLDQVLKSLMSVYPVQIRLANEELAACKLTASFEDEPIEVILRIIADTFGIQLSTDPNGHYVLDGEAC